jgi:hypothetical protein
MKRPQDEAVEAAARGKFIRIATNKHSDTGPIIPPWWARGPPSELQLEAVLTLREASEVTGLSADTLKRHYGNLIRRLSPRRLGIKLRDVLAIGSAA